jgi:glycosyltransferase involved in cell wall biosynthesis
MTDSKRIAIVLPDLRGGGAERISVNLANNLIQRGHDVDMVLLSATGQFLEALDPEVCVVDLKVKRIRWAVLPLVRYLQETEPSALLACMWPLTVLSVVAHKFANVTTRIVVAEHVTWSVSQADYSPIHRLVIKKTMQFFFPSAKAVVAVSVGAADDLSRFAGIARDRVTTIYNPVIDASNEVVHETEIFGSERWHSASCRILTVGALKEQKNHELLLRAFAILVEHTNAQLLILGEGHLRNRLEKLIIELGIEARVSMPGFISDPSPYYQHANLFVLSSDFEGLPTVLIEALACGTPVVSTNCPSGPHEILCGGQFGRLIPLGDTMALAEAMLKSLSENHDSKVLKERAQYFSIDRAVDQYLEILLPAS